MRMRGESDSAGGGENVAGCSVEVVGAACEAGWELLGSTLLFAGGSSLGCDGPQSTHCSEDVVCWLMVRRGDADRSAESVVR